MKEEEKQLSALVTVVLQEIGENPHFEATFYKGLPEEAQYGAFINSLAQKLSRVLGFYGVLAVQNGFT